MKKEKNYNYTIPIDEDMLKLIDNLDDYLKIYQEDETKITPTEATEVVGSVRNTSSTKPSN